MSRLNSKQRCHISVAFKLLVHFSCAAIQFETLWYICRLQVWDGNESSIEHKSRKSSKSSKKPAHLGNWGQPV